MVVMTVFAGIAGAIGVIAALRGTRSRRISPYDLLLMTAATHKLARLMNKDAVTSPLRMPFTRYRDTAGPAEVMEDVREAIAGADYLQLIYAYLQQAAQKEH